MVKQEQMMDTGQIDDGQIDPITIANTLKNIFNDALKAETIIQVSWMKFKKNIYE